jgi:Tfp pilus assembly protein PilO
MEPNLQNKVSKLQVPSAVKASKNSLLAITALLIVGFLFYWFLLSPKLAEVTAKKADAVKFDSQKQGVEGDVSALQDLSQDLGQHEQDISHLDQALPLTELQLRTQLLMDRLVSSSGVLVGDISISAGNDQVVAGNVATLKNPFGLKRGLNVVSVNVAVSGNFGQLMDLIRRLENYGRIMDIVSVQISAGSSNAPASSAPGTAGAAQPAESQLSMHLTLNTYYFGAQ